MLHFSTFQCRTLNGQTSVVLGGEGNAQVRTTDANNHQKPSRVGKHKEANVCVREREKVSKTEYPSAENFLKVQSVHCEMVLKR